MQTIKNFSRKLQTLYRDADDMFVKSAGYFQTFDLSIFHQFIPPPTGGGHQFLRAFWQESKNLGIRVENNTLSHSTRACLFNSFNFCDRRLHHLRRPSVLFVHRVDGPIDIYRGQEDGIDRRILKLNKEFADKTIFQSRFSLKKHLELGMEFVNPVVILNAVDPDIFNSQHHITFSRDRKIRLMASSWSNNSNKGSPTYAWLDQNLDWDRYEFIFIGRSPIKYKNIRTIDPVTSSELAKYLRHNDIYVTASQNDPCSNSLIEALACGLPAIYLRSGGHPEIVQNAGLGFDVEEEIPSMLEKLINEYEFFQSQISIPTIREVTSTYLHTLELI